MNSVMQETRFNKRANKHTFVVRYYKPKSGGCGKFFMRIGSELFIYCQDKIWRPVRCYNEGLVTWVKNTFGMVVPNKSKFTSCPKKLEYKRK